jgi:hypothetical protein
MPAVTAVQRRSLTPITINQSSLKKPSLIIAQRPTSDQEHGNVASCIHGLKTPAVSTQCSLISSTSNNDKPLV